MDVAGEFLSAVVDPAVPGGLVGNVLRLHGSANQVRERMSNDKLARPVALAVATTA